MLFKPLTPKPHDFFVQGSCQAPRPGLFTAETRSAFLFLCGRLTICTEPCAILDQVAFFFQWFLSVVMVSSS